MRMDAPRRLAAFGLALVLAGCDSATVTPSATGIAVSSDAPVSSSSPGDTPAPGATDGPGGGPDTGELWAIADLPVPTMNDPFAIGEALYDPSRMTQAVVSLLHLMGVAIYTDDGLPIDAGNVADAGAPWLFQSEVWQLVDIGKEDMLAAPDEGPKFRLDDLYDALREGLPADFSLEQFRMAYADTYAGNPDDLVPSVMLGQPIDSSTPLTRVQLWLLYMDGFAELPPAPTADVRDGRVAAGGRPRAGTANPSLPPLARPHSLTERQWRELTAHFGVIAGRINFRVAAGSAHEGHGGPGSVLQITARYNSGSAIVSPVTGSVLLQAGTGSLGGLQVTWQTNDLAIYNAHGTLAASLPGTTTTDAQGIARIRYTPKREQANGQGTVATELATITATAAIGDLVQRAFTVDASSMAWWLRGGLFGVPSTKTGQTTIEWHTPGIEIEIVNAYDVTVSADTGGLVAFAHRKGSDTFKGTLTKRSDGTYRGVLIGHTKAAAQMEFAAGVSNIQCEDATDTYQYVTVVARRRDPVIDPKLDVLASGTFGPDDFVLQFYPAGEPDDPGRCQGTIDYSGPGPDGRRMSGTYSSYSDSRFTDPSLGGFRIHLPKLGETLRYEDRRLLPENVKPVEGVDSLFTITVTRHPGS